MKRKSWLDVLETCLSVVLILCMALSVVSIFSQVVFRYVFRNPLVWSEEVARYSLIWMTMIGAAVATRHGQHLLIDSIVSRFSERNRQRAAVVLQAISIAFCLLMSWLGVEISRLAWKAISPATHIPMGVVYASMPIGFVCMAVYAIEGMCKTISDMAKGTVQAASAGSEES